MLASQMRYVKLHRVKIYAANMYGRMKYRINHLELWRGLELCDRSVFMAWFCSNKFLFKRMYRTYLKSGKSRALAPSINRINSKLGYTPENMEIITHGKNSGLRSEPRPCFIRRGNPKKKAVMNDICLRKMWK